MGWHVPAPGDAHAFDHSPRHAWRPACQPWRRPAGLRLADQPEDAHDTWSGGQGHDTLELVFTPEQLALQGFLESLAQQLQAFRAMVAAQAQPTGELSAAQDARFTFTFGDGSLSVARIEEIHVAPTLVSAHLRITEDATVPVTWANFGYSDPGSPTVLMSVLWADGGQFEVRVDGAWAAARSFTGAQLHDGQVRFVQLPLLPAQASAMRLTPQHINIYDPDTAPAALSLLASDLQGGGIYRAASITSPPNEAVSAFTWSELLNGRIFWIPVGDRAASQFTLRVSDGQATSDPITARAGAWVAGTAPTASPITDWLTGTASNDHLLGGSGHDVLSGGPGADFLTGGAGQDHFVWGWMPAT